MIFPKPAKGTAKRARQTRNAREQRRFLDAVWFRDACSVPGHQAATCVLCRLVVVRGVNGEVDHIIPRSVRPDLKYEPSNGRIVCTICHRARHHQRCV